MKRLSNLLVAFLLASLLFTNGPGMAQANYRYRAHGDVKIGLKYGTHLRAKFTEHWNGTGHTFLVYGSTKCTRSYTRVDNRVPWLRSYGWDNAASRAYDYNRCDVKFYEHPDFRGRSKGYTNYGARGGYVGNRMNDRISSFKLS